MEYNSGSNLASDFKSAKRKVEITSTITLELYDTKSSYQLIGSMAKCKKLSVYGFLLFQGFLS